MKNTKFLFLTLFWIVFLNFRVNAQCDTSRYRYPIFSSDRSISDEIFQNAPSLVPPCTFESLTINLNYGLDVYTPVGDTCTSRPCLVFAHGGGFLIGEKRIIPVPDYCHGLAKMGYVVISLDYRECFNNLSSTSAERAVYRAIQDMKAAIRWTKANAAMLKIDTNLVFAGGNSAGSFMAIHAAYVSETERAGLPSSFLSPDLGCLDCSGNSLTNIGRPVGVINLWGSIADTSWIEASDNIPILNIHGDSDILVFPDSGRPFSDPIFPFVYGSIPIHRYASSLGIPSELHLLPGEGHEPWLTSTAWLDYIIETSGDFLYRNFMKPAPLTGITGENSPCLGDTETYWVPYTVGSTYCWDYSGATLISSATGGSLIEISWNVPGFHSLTAKEITRHDAPGDPVSLSINAGPALGSLAINRSGDTLYVDPGFSYQWYKNDWAIPGATNNYFVGHTTGVFTVLVSDAAGCSFLVGPFPFEPVSVDPVIGFGDIFIYPNPASTLITLELLNPAMIPAKLEIFDMMGYRRFHRNIVSQITTSDISGLSAGLYFAKITTPQGILAKKILIQ